MPSLAQSTQTIMLTPTIATRYSLPASYRLALALSFALVAHTLAVSVIQHLFDLPERKPRNLAITLIQAGDDQPVASDISRPAIPDSRSANATPKTSRTPEQLTTIKAARDVVAPEPESSTSSIQPPAPAQPTAAAAKPSTEGHPSPHTSSQRTNISQLSSQQIEPENSYVTALERQIGQELSKWPVPSSHSIEQIVSMEIELHLLGNGAVRGVDVKRSTGIAPLDQSAVRAAMLASPYPEPPRSDKRSGDLRFRVEIKFSPERI